MHNFISRTYQGKEDEKNWAGREVSMERVRGMLLGKAFIKYPEVFVRCLRSGWMEGSLKGVSLVLIPNLGFFRTS